MEQGVFADDLPELVPVGAWPSLAEAQEHALVVLAMNRECWIFPEAGHYALHAPGVEAEPIHQELALYEREQAERLRPVDLPVFPAGLSLAGLWVLAMLAVFLRQGMDPTLAERFCNSSVALMEGGEWWRAFTALFLHADAGHLISNAGLGGVFCVMVAQTLGAWRGWAMILAAGTVGNLVNAWARYPENFLSLGASTATFAAVGILAGVATVRAWRLHSLRELRPLLVPVLAGLMVLGWYGTGGEGGGGNTDVAGHVAGWVAGFTAGALSAKFVRAAKEAGEQAEKGR